MLLRDKLKFLDPSVPQRADPKTAGSGLNLEGEEVRNKRGVYFRTLHRLNFGTPHGSFPLWNVHLDDWSMFKAGGSPAESGRLLFLDTETTGLAGGTGTVPFMIGLGWFEESGFCVEQLFLREFTEESAVLEAFRERLDACDALVSYNGKAFDLHLLNSRFVLSRMRLEFDKPHIDLLFAARRMWKRRLQECSLIHLEKSVLNFFREEDVPAYLIPGLYFDYLRSGSADPLRPVFTHNRWDIVSLGVLLGVLAGILSDPIASLEHPIDLFSAGRWYESAGRSETARQCYERALTLPLETGCKLEVQKNLGFLFKRMGLWSEAVSVWQGIVETAPFCLFPYEELAKFFEHRAGNPAEARGWVDRALDRMEAMQLRQYCDLSLDRDRMLHRLGRLRRKLSGENGIA